jgi:alpha-galactosidase
MRLTRREALRLAAAAPLAAAAAPKDKPFDLVVLKRARARVVPDVRALKLTRTWQGSRLRTQLQNTGREPVRVQQVVLLDVEHGLPGDTRVYGEGFQMLSQTGGTLAQPADLGDYTDAKHYKMPQPEAARVVHGMLTLSPPNSGHRLLGFASCKRFDGKFQLRPGRIEAVVDTEGQELRPGEAWTLEDLVYLQGPDREALLASLAGELEASHPPLRFAAPPSGWCSWYCFGPKVTAKQVLDNLDVIAKEIPGLKYIQIDDGYQPAMGDWLLTGAAFGGGVQDVLKRIRGKGFEPAIWIAPFIAEKDSQLFQQHPDWFVKDADGSPLRADKVTFGGWRRGPWYALDGTHPDAQRHLEHVCRTMREEWGVTYFKLDANFWGAIHGGKFHDPRATRIEAYRRGMQAVLRGTRDAFVLGCNHPIWPSLGLVHGSRSSNDIKRSWARVAGTARQNLQRNWQNGRLWWNDPDAVCLMGELSEDEFLFHATAIHATGGMLLSGDDLTRISPERMALLRKLHPPTGVAARFADESLRVGSVDLPDRRLRFLLNWGDRPGTLRLRLPGPHRVHDLWSGADLGVYGPEDGLALPPHSGRVLVCRAVRG